MLKKINVIDIEYILNQENVDSGALAGKIISDLIFPPIKKDLSCYVTHESIFLNVVFKEIDFLGTDLGKTKFTNCTFIDCRIIKCDIYGSDFENCLFIGNSFFRTHLAYCSLKRCILSKNVLEKAIISKCNLDYCIFEGYETGPILNENLEKNVIWIADSPASSDDTVTA